MTPEELALRQHEIDAQTKRYEMRAGIWKVAVGTGIVGFAAAFFPFAQQYATEYYAAKISMLRQEAELERQRQVASRNRPALIVTF